MGREAITPRDTQVPCKKAALLLAEAVSQETVGKIKTKHCIGVIGRNREESQPDHTEGISRCNNSSIGYETPAAVKVQPPMIDSKLVTFPSIGQMCRLS